MNSETNYNVSMIGKLKNFVTSSKSGEVAGARLNFQYFQKHSLGLLKYVQDETSFYSDEEIEFQNRVKLALRGATSRMRCKVCESEISPNRKYDEKLPQVCSTSCAGKSNLGRSIIYSEDRKESITAKRKMTMVDIYGVETNSQRPEVAKKLSDDMRKRNTHINYAILEDRELLTALYEKHPSTTIAEMVGCFYGTVLGYLQDYGVPIDKHQKISNEQYIIAEMVKIASKTEPLMNQKVLNGSDIDILCGKVGIEYNGFPWHLDNFTDGLRGGKYHSTKTKLSRELGIKLLHIFPHQLYSRRDIVQSIINANFGNVESIHARKCVMRELDVSSARDFLECNHMNGYTNASIRVGMFYNEQLVHVMTFGKSRYRKSDTFEIIRSASLLNTRVVGAVSRCIKFFMSNYMTTNETLITYADLSLSDGKSYEMSGMTKVDTTAPNYFYVHRNNNYVPESRLKYQKHKLTDFDEYSVDKTEWEIMKDSGYDRYWDCGSNVYQITK